MTEPSTETLLNALDDMPEEARDILNFWFLESTPENHFQKDTAFDERIRQLFLPIIDKLRAGLYLEWLKTAGGSMASCIALDQFTRNIYRGTPESFASDFLALKIACYIRDEEIFVDFPDSWRRFCFMPFMHSESIADQIECIRLGNSFLMDRMFVSFAEKHKVIIERFGRFPHRNAILNRVSTAEEIAFLQEPDSSF